MKIKDVLIRSKRETDIPATVVEAGSFPCRLLICVHGFKANRTEDGRFLEVAKALSAHGFSSVMMGFPGCDESKEDFFDYTLKNCLDDIDSSYVYMKDHYELDLDAVAMIGYSMGGRLVSLYSSKHPEVKCICLWAAASFEGFDGSDEFLGEKLEKLKKEADEKGYCVFYNSFDDEYLKMNKGFLDDMEELPVKKSLNAYEENALIVHGDKDVTVLPRVAEETYGWLINAKDRKLHMVKGADHSFGGWNCEHELSKELTSVSISYILDSID